VIHQVAQYLFAFVMGLGIGVFYFGGLWWTVRRLGSVKRPALWTLGSFILRTGVCLFIFYLVMGDRWERLMVSLLGFMIIRLISVRVVRTTPVAMTENRGC
jgi:F1F0 ATPase subunit 2